jgi:hypothetical protein
MQQVAEMESKSISVLSCCFIATFGTYVEGMYIYSTGSVSHTNVSVDSVLDREAHE